MRDTIKALEAEYLALPYNRTPKGREEYDRRAREITDKFKAELFKDLGIEENPKRYALFSKAWEMGHSAGYHEVYNYALDLVDLIQPEAV